jgi:cytochrome b6-f complex iron-sulfur subunit
MPSSVSISLGRRNFFSLVWRGLLALGGIGSLGSLYRFLSFQNNINRPLKYDLGPVSKIPIEKVLVINNAQAALIRQDGEIKAVSLICPHLGCIVEQTSAGFQCPCHGSQFDMDGGLQKGPADRPLDPLTLDISEDGHLILTLPEK